MIATQLVLPIDLPGIPFIEATIAMLDGHSRLVQCGQCGVAMAVPDCGAHRHNARLSGCPRCGCSTWWNQDMDGLGPFDRTEASAADSRRIVDRWLAGEDF